MNQLHAGSIQAYLIRTAELFEASSYRPIPDMPFTSKCFPRIVVSTVLYQETTGTMSILLSHLLKPGPTVLKKIVEHGTANGNVPGGALKQTFGYLEI